MNKRDGDPAEPRGTYAYEGLDRVLHEKARLGILTALLTHADGLVFGQLKELCSLTDGNLSRHLQVLQEAGLVEACKGFEGRRPQTLVRLSTRGRHDFLAYLQELERVIADARTVREAQSRPGFGTPRGWAPS